MVKSHAKKRKVVNKKRKTPADKYITPCDERVIYLDNNGTTQLCPPARREMIRWLDSRSNPSSDSIVAAKARELLDFARSMIATHCGTTLSRHAIVFTSGASESNSLILRSVAEAYAKHKKNIPHIITSATEHKSIIQCCNALSDNHKARITYIEPNAYGCISPALIEQSITVNTALISIMSANNELGCINNIKEIGRIARSHNIPFHTDAVQLFGKYKIPLVKYNIDALSMSFHKLYGPMGVGMLIISNELLDGYGIKGQISGSQQGELRGGTENVPGIAGGVAALQSTFRNRDKKNQKMYDMKMMIILELRKHLKQGTYETYFNDVEKKRNEFVVMGPVINGNCKKPNVLPNTLLICFVKNVMISKTDKKPFCNIDLKKMLDCENVIVSVGSACSTSDKKASHVLYSIRAPDIIRQGVVRISLSDTTTKREIIEFLKILVRCLGVQMTLL